MSWDEDEDDYYEPGFEETLEYEDQVYLSTGRYVAITASRYYCGHTEKGNRWTPDEFVYDRIDDPEWSVEILNENGDTIEGELTDSEKDEVKSIVEGNLAIDE